MILEIPLQPIINQTLTCVINEQTLNITIKGISVNNKPLQNNTPAFEPKDEIIDKTLVLASSIYMMASINLNNTPIIANAYCNNAVYINQFPSNLNGYLFFYKDDWYDGNDKIYYTNFGTNGNTHLYYSDYDILQYIYDDYCKQNKVKLLQRFVYG